MPKNVLIDTGFWFALYDSRDSNHNSALDIVEILETENILIPWPTLYETLNTSFSENRSYMAGFDTFISKPFVNKINDEDYKNKAYDNIFEFSKNGKRTFSLVDLIIREMLMDIGIKIHYLLTYNEHDFSDLVYIRGLEFYK
jgi:predicted nucleic acid-binding protein